MKVLKLILIPYGTVSLSLFTWDQFVFSTALRHAEKHKENDEEIDISRVYYHQFDLTRRSLLWPIEIASYYFTNYSDERVELEIERISEEKSFLSRFLIQPLELLVDYLAKYVNEEQREEIRKRRNSVQPFSWNLFLSRPTETTSRYFVEYTSKKAAEQIEKLKHI